MRFLYTQGSLYKVYNGNLLYHGCVPLNEDGTFTRVNVFGKEYAGKELYDVLEGYARKGYYAIDPKEKKKGQDILWFIWENQNSPVFGKAKMTDKERLFRFRRASKVNIYSLDGLEDYYYGYMVPSTGYLKYFKLYSYEDGFVLQMPVREAPEVIPEFEPQHKLFKVMRETGKWGEELGVATVGELNELITGCLLYTSPSPRD